MVKNRIVSVPRLVGAGVLAISAGFVLGTGIAQAKGTGNGFGQHDTTACHAAEVAVVSWDYQNQGCLVDEVYDTGSTRLSHPAIVPFDHEVELDAVCSSPGPIFYCPPVASNPAGGVTSYVTTQVLVPWTWNGCEPDPAIRSYHGAIVQPPNAQTVPQGVWITINEQGVEGQILPGPGFGTQSEELQLILHTEHSAPITNAQGQVVGTHTWWTASDDGGPYWQTEEIYNPNQCPYPVVNVTSEGGPVY